MTATQITNLLSATEVKSADYNTVRALVRGEIDTFLGFKDTGDKSTVAQCANNTNVPNFFGTSAAAPHAAAICRWPASSVRRSNACSAVGNCP